MKKVSSTILLVSTLGLGIGVSNANNNNSIDSLSGGSFNQQSMHQQSLHQSAANVSTKRNNGSLGSLGSSNQSLRQS